MGKASFLHVPQTSERPKEPGALSIMITIIKATTRLTVFHKLSAKSAGEKIQLTVEKQFNSSNAIYLH